LENDEILFQDKEKNCSKEAFNLKEIRGCEIARNILRMPHRFVFSQGQAFGSIQG